MRFKLVTKFYFKIVENGFLKIVMGNVAISLISAHSSFVHKLLINNCVTQLKSVCPLECVSDRLREIYCMLQCMCHDQCTGEEHSILPPVSDSTVTLPACVPATGSSSLLASLATKPAFGH